VRSSYLLEGSKRFAATVPGSVIQIALSCILVFGAAAQFQIKGEAKSHRLTSTGQLIREHQREFTVDVQECSWRIETTTTLSNQNVFASWTMGSTNGTEIFQVQFERPLVVVATNRKARVFNSAIVSSNSFPTESADRMIPHLWLMFASACTVKQQTNDYLVPVFDPMAAPTLLKDLRMKTRTSWLDPLERFVM